MFGGVTLVLGWAIEVLARSATCGALERREVGPQVVLTAVAAGPNELHVHRANRERRDAVPPGIGAQNSSQGSATLEAVTHSDPEMRGRALIVEDDQDLRVVLAILLSTEGWQVATAATFDDAVVQLGDMPDLLLLDVQLGPHRAGELLAQLACRIDAPVTVLVSGCDELPDVARRYGVAYARKPIEIDALMHAIDVAIAQARRPGIGHMRATWISIRPPLPSTA